MAHSLRSLVRHIAVEWGRNQIPKQAAAIAYYAVFSLPPLLLVMMWIAGSIIGDDVVRTDIFARIDLFIGGSAGELLKSAITGITLSGRGWLMTLVGAGALLLAAIGIFRDLRSTLDRMLSIKPRPRKGIVATVIGHMPLFALLLAVSIGIVASVGVTTAMTVVQEYAAETFGMSDLALSVGTTLVPFVIVFLLLTVLYSFLPSKRLPLQYVSAGASVASLLLLMGSSVFGWYVRSAHVGAAYGVASSAMVLMVWLYWSSLAFLIGGEVIEGLLKDGRKRR